MRDVRILGAVGVIEVDRLPSPVRVREVVRATGVWLRPFGRWIYTMPPFVTTTEEIIKIADAMKRLAHG